MTPLNNHFAGSRPSRFSANLPRLDGSPEDRAFVNLYYHQGDKGYSPGAHQAGTNRMLTDGIYFYMVNVLNNQVGYRYFSFNVAKVSLLTREVIQQRVFTGDWGLGEEGYTGVSDAFIASGKLFVLFCGRRKSDDTPLNNPPVMAISFSLADLSTEGFKVSMGAAGDHYSGSLQSLLERGNAYFAWAPEAVAAWDYTLGTPIFCRRYWNTMTTPKGMMVYSNFAGRFLCIYSEEASGVHLALLSLTTGDVIIKKKFVVRVGTHLALGMTQRGSDIIVTGSTIVSGTTRAFILRVNSSLNVENCIEPAGEQYALGVHPIGMNLVVSFASGKNVIYTSGLSTVGCLKSTGIGSIYKMAYDPVNDDLYLECMSAAGLLGHTDGTATAVLIKKVTTLTERIENALATIAIEPSSSPVGNQIAPTVTTPGAASSTALATGTHAISFNAVPGVNALVHDTEQILRKVVP